MSAAHPELSAPHPFPVLHNIAAASVRPVVDTAMLPCLSTVHALLQTSQVWVCAQVRVDGIVRANDKPSMFVPANDPATGQFFWIDVPVLAKACGLPEDAPLIEVQLHHKMCLSLSSGQPMSFCDAVWPAHCGTGQTVDPGGASFVQHDWGWLAGWWLQKGWLAGWWLQIGRLPTRAGLQVGMYC